MTKKEFIIAIGGEKYAEAVLSYPVKLCELDLFYSSYDSFVSLGKSKDDPGLYFLSSFIQLAYEALSDKVPLDIQLDTFSDITTWERWYQRHTGKIGLDRINWLRNHIEGKLFRLGELQFERIDNIPNWASNLKFPILFVHIPEGAVLRKTEESIQKALGFFSFDECTFITHSWLLSPEIEGMLSPESSIRYFASLFTLLGTDDDRQAEERLFGEISDDIDKYVAKTSLAGKAKELLLSGKRIRSGYGYLERNRIKQ